MRTLNMTFTALVLMLAVAGAGCGPSQQEMMARDHLANARATYAQAQADPHVAAYAPTSLNIAGRYINEASNEDDYIRMDNLAFMAEREAQAAIANTCIKMAEQERNDLRRKNDTLQQQLMMQSSEDPEAARKEERAARAMGWK
jgi:hypothetical protein